MAKIDYPKNYSAFTGLIPPYTKPNSTTLKGEIEVSDIVTALHKIETDDGTSICHIWFKDELSAGDQTILDGIVTAHTGAPPPTSNITDVKIIDTDELDPSQARTVEEGFLIDIEVGVNPTHLFISFAYPVDLLSGKYFVAHPEHSYLDNMSVFVIPPGDAPIGAVAQAADIGATEVYVEANALQNLKSGFYTRFQASAKEYRITNIDYGTGKLTIEPGLDVAASAGHTVHLRIPFVITQLILKSTLEMIGNAAAGSSGLPAGYVLRVDYNHYVDPTEATKLGFALAYKY